MSKDAAYEILDKVLERLQSNHKVRRGLAGLLIVGLLAVAGEFLYDLLPRQYDLTITGGDILSNRHHLAKVLQQEALPNGVTLTIHPAHGSVEALEKVDKGELDIAIVQGGLDVDFPHVQHVATLAPELIHFLVRPGIERIDQIRGKVVSMGAKGGGTRVVASQILEFSGLESGIDYVEVNQSAEELLSMRPDRLPDVVVNVSTVPSYLADFLVRERGYQLMEMPFPDALALRLGWVANATILGHTYSVAPAVPPRTIRTIGVNLHVVANDQVEPRAVFALLATLYSPAVAARMRERFDEDKIMIPSGFPVSEGTELFLARNEPMLSAQLWDQAQSAFGLVMSVLSTVLVVVKWFRGGQPKPTKDDGRFLDYMGEIGRIEAAMVELQRSGKATAAPLGKLEARLGEIAAEVLQSAAEIKLDDPTLMQDLLLCVQSARGRLDRMTARVPVVAGRDAR